MTSDEVRAIYRAADVIQHEVTENGRDPETVLRHLVWQGVDQLVVDRALALAVGRLHLKALRGDFGYFDMFWAAKSLPFLCGWVVRILTLLTIPATLAAAWILVSLHHPGVYGMIAMAAAAMASGFVFWSAGLVLIYLYRQTASIVRDDA